MNRIYRLVWNMASGLWVAVAENARGRGRGGSSRKVVQAGFVSAGFSLNSLCRGALAMLAALMMLPHGAQAADAANAGVSAGAAGIATVGNTTTINQSSQRVAIDWTSLSTAANEALIFNQPNAQAIALNRITGSSPSELLGSLTANGQVFILNPNGVLFGAGSQVNVGGLVASTLSLSNADFMSGNHVFTGSGGSGSVVNQGTLNAAPGGYLALLAPEVRNEGVMTASLGTALLAAGNKVTLNLDNGSLLSYSIDQGAINALAENKQLIKADGGQVLLGAKALDSLTTATVNNTGVIEAKTLQNKAGRILLMGDMETGTVNVAGTLDASAPAGGDGGFIETSAAHVKVAAGTRVSTLSGTGKTGTWLVDPTDFTIASGSGTQTTSGIGADTLSANLATTSVTLETDASTGSGSGDINVNAAVTWSANTTLTLNAYNNIHINAAITATGDSAGLVLNHGNYAATGSVTSGTDYKVGAPITLSGANATLAISGTAYTLIHSMAQLEAVGRTLMRDKYALAGDLDAGGTTYTRALMGNSNNYFIGTFAGLGHTISNLTINSGPNGYTGLFGYTDRGSVIRDIGLVGGSVSGNNAVGALAGRNTGSISNAYATGSVSGNIWVGGLVGESYFGSISNSYATGSVSGTTGVVGGLVGTSGTDNRISNSYATGSVSGPTNVGALVGVSSGTITASFWLNSVSTRGIGSRQSAGTIDSLTRGLSASEATSASTYSAAGWGVATAGGSSSVWRIYDSKTMPLLRSFLTALTVKTGDVSKTYDGTTSLSGSYTPIDSSADTGLILGTAAYSTSSKNVGSYAVSTSGLYSGQQGYDISYADGTATITAATLTVSGSTAANKTYDGTTAATLSGSLTGLISGDTVALSQSGTFSDKNAGTGKTVSYTSSVSGADAGNYLLVSGSGSTTADITAATLTVTGTTAANKTYDGTAAAALSGSLTGLISGDSVALSQSGTFSDKNAAAGKTVSYTSSVSGGDAGNYVLASGSGTTTADITAATLTVTGTTAANKAYDGTTAASVSGGALSGLVSGDTVALSQSGSFSDKNAATGKTVTIANSLSGSDAGNYVVAAASTTASISQAALTISGITAGDKTYNASDAATVNTAGARYGGLIAGDAVNVAATGVFSDKNAGAGKTVNLSSSYSGADVGNYAITDQASTTANISQAALTVSGITAADKAYNASNAATVSTVGASYSGLFAGDAVNVAATGQFSDKNAGAGKTVNLSSSYSGADVGNYAITNQATTTASISQAALTISGITAADKTYNASDVATVNTSGASYSGLFAGDVVNVTATGLFGDKNVGTGKTVALSSSYSGADAGNYAITGQAATTASISQATLTISGITAADKTYNASDAATVNTAGVAYNGLFAGDVVSVAATGLFSDKNAGAGKTVNLSSRYTGTDVGNYAITNQASATATIGQAALTVSGITAADKTYDAGTAATVNTTGASYSGLFAGDVVNVAATGLFSDKNAGANKTVNLSSSYSGADAGNYAITSQAGTTATITKADLTVQASGVGKVYDGTTAATVAFSSNGLAGDVLNLTGNASFADPNAGLNKAVSVTGIAAGGADAGNYNLISGSTAATTADITPKQLTVTANNDTQPSGNPYSGGNGVRYDGLATGDTAATVLAGNLAYGGSAQGAYLAGEYEITPGGLLANGNYSLRFVQGRLTLSGGDAASAALGGTVLVGAYDASKNTTGGLNGFQLSVEGGGFGDEAKRAFLNATAADAREVGGE